MAVQVGSIAIPIGGGGGGGRIAVYYADMSGFTGTIQAQGGAGYQKGAAGTVYTKSSSETLGNLLIDNGGTAGAAITPLSSASESLEDVNVTLANGAVVYPGQRSGGIQPSRRVGRSDESYIGASGVQRDGT